MPRSATRKCSGLALHLRMPAAACSQTEPEKRQALLVDLFAPNGLRLSVGRCIGSSDYSRYAYSYDDSTDPDPVIRFSIDHDREYILLTLGAALKLNPEVFLSGCRGVRRHG